MNRVNIIDEAIELDALTSELVEIFEKAPIHPMYARLYTVRGFIGDLVDLQIDNPDLMPPKLIEAMIEYLPWFLKLPRRLVTAKLGKFSIADFLPSEIRDLLVIGKISKVRLVNVATNKYFPTKVGNWFVLARLMWRYFKTLTGEGAGMGSSQVAGGTSRFHVEAAKRIGDFIGYPPVALFAAGYLANLAIIGRIINSVYDMKRKTDTGAKRVVRIGYALDTHNSLLGDKSLWEDAGRAVTHPVNTHDFEAFQRQMQAILEEHGEYPDVLLVMGVGSTTGKMAELLPIMRFCKQHCIKVLLDDAHGIGVIGKTGRGTLEQLGIPKELWPDWIMGTFSKSFDGIGGFIATLNPKLKHQVWIKGADPILFTAANQATTLGQLLIHLDYLEAHPEAFPKIMARNTDLKQYLRGKGVEIAPTSDCTSILSLVIHRKVGESREEFKNRVYQAFVELACVGRIYGGVFIFKAVGSAKLAYIRMGFTAQNSKGTIKHIKSVIPVWAKRHQVVAARGIQFAEVSAGESEVA